MPNTLAALQASTTFGRRALYNGGPIGEQGDAGLILNAPRRRRWSTATRMLCSDTGVSKPVDSV